MLSNNVSKPLMWDTIAPSPPPSSDSRLAPFLVALALVASQFNYLLVSWLQEERHAVDYAPEFWGGLVFLCGALLITRRRAGRRPTLERDLKVPVYFLGACLTWIVLGDLLKGTGPRSVITYGSLLLYVIAAKRLFEQHLRSVSRFMPVIVLAMSGIWLATLLGFELSGRMTVQNVGGVGRLEISGGLRSTELAIFTGMQFACLLYVWLAARRRVEKALSSVLLVMNVGLLFRLLALSAILGYGAIIGVFLLLNRSKRWMLLAMAICVAALIVADQNYDLLDNMSEAFSQKYFVLSSGHEPRGEIYSYLWDLALAHPMTGIGSGRFVEVNALGGSGKPVTAHQNLLEVAAENGLPAAVLYLGFVLSTLVVAVRGMHEFKGTGRRVPVLLITLATACFAYQQLRGLVQETWLIKETYFWAGAALGAVAFARRLKDPVWMKRTGTSTWPTLTEREGSIR